MYRKNLQSTTEPLPETINNLNPLQITVPGNRTEKLQTKQKGRSIVAAIFVLLLGLTYMGCESGGTVGSGIITDGEGVEVNTYEIETANVIHENSYSGRLTFTPAGHVVDPLYGTIRSVVLLKPVITQAGLDAITDDDRIFLSLIFRDDIYGSQFAESSYEIYEAAAIWRGNQLRYNQEVEVDFSQKVGEFRVADNDSMTVELSNEWKNKFAGFFNSEAANRDSLYRNEFPGLAIVPSMDNQNLRFLRTGGDPDQPELSVTKFLVKSPTDENEDGDEEGDGEESENGDDDSGDGEENGSGEQVRELELRDWGASYIRSEIPEHGTGFILHNTETVLEILADIPFDRFSSKNITNAQLIFTKNRSFEQAQPGFERLSPDLVQVHVFDEVPNDIMGEIFITDPDFFRVKEEDEESFRIDITQFIIDQAYGEESESRLYLTTQVVNGLIYTTTFYDHQAPADVRPRIAITTIK